ncbi:lytic murein transglycosylase [Mesorhizobium sp. B2-3-11]|nr:lytic murein transglycosylase [Mesorhizobium sp. B2-3-11]
MRGAPLWPAGHLPLKGGDCLFWLFSPITNVAELSPTVKLPISPLEGPLRNIAGGLL